LADVAAALAKSIGIEPESTKRAGRSEAGPAYRTGRLVANSPGRRHCYFRHRKFSLKRNLVGQDKLTINKSDIQSREDTPNSMMPAGLINTMADQNILDLVSFLTSQKEIALT